MTDTIETNVGGARVTVNPANAPASPSQAFVAKANEEVNVTDVGGRSITLRRPDLLEEYYFVEMLGAAAKNDTFVGMAAPLLFVRKIDGVQTPTPRTRSELDALIKRLDRHGLNAVAAGIREHFEDVVAGSAAAESDMGNA